MLNKLRATLDSAFESIGREFSKLGVPPTGWTLFGLLFALLSSLAYLNGSYSGQAVAGLLILISGLLDLVDGAVARAIGKTTKRGAFFDSTLDRVGEVAIYLGVMVGGYSTPGRVFVAATFSLLVSYTRARGDALGVDLSGVGIGERSERLLVLAVSSLVGLVGYGVIVVSVLAILTFLERTRIAWRILSKEVASASRTG